MTTSPLSSPIRVVGKLCALVGTLYLALNLVALHMVPIVMIRVEIEVEVVDGESGAPIPQAALHRSREPSDGGEVEARTGENGLATITTVAKVKQRWMLPARGEARLASLELHVHADSFAPQIVCIKDLKVALPRSRPAARIRVLLRRR